ncbi:hypothetical protein DYB36_005698 [Aphanomyces astaci]|uniref:CASTOR ACT domain-containing protein n=1 Tax=Aphanomyces astaci TaxID=112090 RepID=A0A396ZTL8_APHAT|nr:hypothetical protein DYB36_005698 [Aphanomyces astaci]
MLLAAAQVSVAQSPNTSVASVCSSCVISVCSLLLYGECSLNCREDDATSGDHICRLQQTELFSMVVDNDGITLFVDPNGINMFKAADKIRTAPQHWRAIQDMESECELRLGVDPNVLFDYKPVVACGQYLAVYPERMVLVRLKKEALRESAFGLTQLVLRSSSSSSSTTASFWCYCETAEEISLILDDECLANFAEHAVIVSHERWRVIKLCGKTYDFDATGIVAAMSGLNAVDTQVLNISSFGSNVTLVLDEALDASVASLCESLKMTRVEYRGVGRGETGDVVPC